MLNFYNELVRISIWTVPLVVYTINGRGEEAGAGRGGGGEGVGRGKRLTEHFRSRSHCSKYTDWQFQAH